MTISAETEISPTYPTAMEPSRILSLLILFVLVSATGRAQQTDDYEILQKEVRVSMPDGTELWGCLTMPEAAQDGQKFPALLVYDPYAGGCSLTYYYEGPQAKRGYVVGYFHVRGSGLSEGTFFDREYSQQELDDAVELIEWLATQPWSTGKVGMYGWSWSGFNALQVAMMKPEGLEAIIANVATENIYHEDVHYADGIFRFDEYNTFADLNLIYTPPPLDPTDEQLLRQRFDRPPLSLKYLKEQKDGPFWRKSIRLDENPDTLSVPTYMMGGWYDGYRSSIPRILEHAKVPAKALIGPWEHSLETHEPAADLPKMMLRWWDYWLKGKETGVMGDPDLIAYMRAPYLPAANTDTIPGRWQGVDNWPPDGLEESTWYLSPDRQLTPEAAPSDTLLHRYIPTAGSEAGIWWGNVLPDQRAADAHSMIFETGEFKNEKAILGRPTAKLYVSAPARHANWVVKLSDVAPDGSVTLITGAAINGTHRNSSVNPEWMEPGKKYELKIPLHFTSWIFKPGHRMRVSVSNAGWPMFWPSPYSMITSLYTGSANPSSIGIPMVTLDSPEESERIAGLVGSRNVKATPASEYELKPHDDPGGWVGPAEIIRRQGAAETQVVISQTDSTENYFNTVEVVYTLSDDDPAHAEVEGTSVIELYDGDRVTVWEGVTTIISDEKHFYYRHLRTLWQDGKQIRQKKWEETVKREFQ